MPVSKRSRWLRRIDADRLHELHRSRRSHRWQILPFASVGGTPLLQLRRSWPLQFQIERTAVRSSRTSTAAIAVERATSVVVYVGSARPAAM